MAALELGDFLRPVSPIGRPSSVDMPQTLHVRSGRASPISETVATEVPVAIFYNCINHVVMMATPADLEDFAVGFSLAEGIIERADEIEKIESADMELGLKLTLTVPLERSEKLVGRERNLTGRTGCGLCGITTLEEALRPLPTLPPTRPISATAISAAIGALPEWQTINHATGAVHAAAFSDWNGKVLAVREDVGRHNAFDKLVGAVVRAGRKPSDGFAMITSRCSMEMVQKAATVGFPLLVAISAPTSLAIKLADGCGLTLVAFARGKDFNIYTHSERIETTD